MLTTFSFNNDVDFNESLQLLRGADANIVEVRDEELEIDIEWANFEELDRVKDAITK